MGERKHIRRVNISYDWKWKQNQTRVHLKILYIYIKRLTWFKLSNQNETNEKEKGIISRSIYLARGFRFLFKRLERFTIQCNQQSRRASHLHSDTSGKGLEEAAASQQQSNQGLFRLLFRPPTNFTGSQNNSRLMTTHTPMNNDSYLFTVPGLLLLFLFISRYCSSSEQVVPQRILITSSIHFYWNNSV